jgi:hypothetical protein
MCGDGLEVVVGAWRLGKFNDLFGVVDTLLLYLFGSKLDGDAHLYSVKQEVKL